MQWSPGAGGRIMTKVQNRDFEGEEVKIDDGVGEQHREGDEESVYRSRGADNRRRRARCYDDVNDPRPYAADEEELKKLLTAPLGNDRHPEHPESEHVKQ